MHFDKLFSYCPVCGSSEFALNNIKSKRCKSCGFTMYVNPAAAVAAFIINENNELLVCVRAKEPEKGTLDLPGGFIDNDESAENAIVRELKEELNVEVVSQKYLFSLPNLYLYSGWTLPTLDMFFSAKIKSYNDIFPDDDVEGFKFIPVNELNPELFGLNSIKKAITIFNEKFGEE